MTIHPFLAPRLMLAGGFALSALVLPTVAAVVSPAADTAVATCPPGESADVYLTTCVPHLVPNSPPLFQTTAANPDVPEIQGIPCVGNNAGACIGLAEDEGGAPAVPRSTVSSSP